MQYLVQLFLPLRDNADRAFPQSLFNDVRERLVERFGGVTAYTRTPTEGIWAKQRRRVKDDLIIYEVMADTLQRRWWRALRSELEERFKQDKVLIRAQKMWEL